MKLLDNLFIIATILVQNSLQFDGLFEGDACRNNDGSQGQCKKSSKCTTVAAAIKGGMRPRICGFENREAILCCPPEKKAEPPKPQHPPQNQQKPEMKRAVFIANQKCKEYAATVRQEINSPVLVFGSGVEIVDHCARVEEALVLGGERAKPREYPHMALIGYGDRNVQWLCGGSLISETFVLSAAHCSKPSNKGPARYVKLGELDTSTDYDEAEPQIIKISKRIDHPQYTSRSLYNDITLFKLEEPAQIDRFVRPICLSTSSDLSISTAIATGWGHQQWGGKPSESLLKVRLNLVSQKACNDKFKGSGGDKLSKGIIESQLCAGDEKGKDTCQGDSGGPLQSPLETPYCMYELIGLTSFGKGCGLGFPGVYSKISHFLPWIVENVWPE